MGIVKPLTQKAINSIANCGYLTVYEGAVRSGKTVASELAWINYITNSPEKFFIMSGNTIASLYRNVISGDYGLLSVLGRRAEYITSRDTRQLIVHAGRGKDKICYCFGANTERSFNSLRGATVGGWYADEVNLQPQSFVEEAFKRSFASVDRKNIWTLNPDNPNHWIYREYTDRYLNEKLPGYRQWFFTLDDNLAIPEERKEELKKQYTGVFYRRYILGERVVAEGVIYDSFSETNIYDDAERPHNLELISQRTIAVDYGTTNPCVFLDIYDDGDTIWVDNEYRWDSQSDEAKRAPRAQKTDGEYGADMVTFMGDNLCEVVVDPSAASFIAELLTRLMFVTQADNAVNDGIRATSNMFMKKKIRVHRERCAGLIGELRSYAWDKKASQKGEDKPIKENDHGADALRYFVFTKLPKWRIGFEERKEERQKVG
ncbi:MAG: PBSX family phage terminase large subunit [Oscillospiraceae bacterium]|jgi:PBSX family phage terminase large subunit|nr:PBSX family phage terminase large subunit [Oscillospiraceae bacterium]